MMPSRKAANTTGEAVKITVGQLRRIIREAVKEAEEEKSPKSIKTVGDLRKLLGKTKRGRHVSSAKAMTPDVVVGAVREIIPYVSTAKTIYDILKAIYSKPNPEKVPSVLQPLLVDDFISRIVDDRVEDAFIAYLADIIKDVPDDFPLEDFDATDLLRNFLKDNFMNRTVTGYKG